MLIVTVGEIAYIQMWISSSKQYNIDVNSLRPSDAYMPGRRQAII